MNYDLIVIGAGPGGYTAAIRGAQEGLNVCLLEKKRLGGTCTNVGCIPTKVYAHAADVLHEFNSAKEFGILGSYEMDIPTLKAKKNQVVSQLTGGISYLLNSCI
jgi:dihydrolipoamide dehydrogenase